MKKDGFEAVGNWGEIEKMIADFKQVFSSAKTPLTAVLSYWHNWNKTNIFGLRGPGKYEDLSEAYKEYKADAIGNAYPILKFDGVLEASITTSNSVYSIAEIGDDFLMMGTTAETDRGDPYALYLQKGTKNMPARPPILKTREQMDKLAEIFFQTAIRMYNQIPNVKGSW